MITDNDQNQYQDDMADDQSSIENDDQVDFEEQMKEEIKHAEELGQKKFKI